MTVLRRLHALRLAFTGDPAGFMDGLTEPFRTLGLLELTAATWVVGRLAIRPHWRRVEAQGGLVLAAAFDAAGDFLAATEAAPGAPGVLRLDQAPARVDIHGYGGGALAVVRPWDPWAVYRSLRAAGAPRAAALGAAWPRPGPRVLAGGAAAFGPAPLPEDGAGATGLAADDFIVPPLDEGDCLAEGAEAALAAAFADPAVVLAYGDEAEAGEPVFKTAFDPVRLESQDYIGRGFAVRPAALAAAGGQWDARRLTSGLPRDAVRHVPQVLWRRARPNPWPVAEEAVRPAVLPGVEVIVPTRDRLALLRACAAGVLERTDYPDLSLCVVDNGSADPETLDLIAELAARPRVRVLRIDGPFDFAALNNAAAARSRAQVLAFLNDDTWVIEPGWLAAMAALAARPDAGAVGAKLFYPDGRIQHAGVALGLGAQGVAGHPFRGAPGTLDGPQAMLRVTREVSAVTGACLVVERRKFEAVGGFDPAFKVAFNDVDLCLRLGLRDWRTVWTPQARLVHLESVSRGGAEATTAKAALLAREAAAMHDRWGPRLDADPYYHPALSLEGERWALAPTPRSRAPR